MSSSVPNNLAHFYEGRIPTRPATANTLPQDTRQERKGEGSAEDSDDDYEPMNPGVTAAAIEVWEERRKSFSVINGLPPKQRTGPKAEGSVMSPVHYTRVIVPASEQSAKPILAKIQQHTGRKRNSTPISHSIPISYTPVFYNKQGTWLFRSEHARPIFNVSHDSQKNKNRPKHEIPSPTPLLHLKHLQLD